ncbi:MAG: gliding motility-associated protein GldE [Salinivirgaceae bacterium]|nr:gliding motility-associated protein GldE [Salinivirgaceae bacterium]
METDPLSAWVILTNVSITYLSFEFATAISIVLVIILLFCSALISGSEVAFFSLNPNEILKISEAKKSTSIAANKLLDNPQKLLATILVSNNFINIAIVILSTYTINSIVSFGDVVVLGFLFQIALITFLLLLFGEIIPKVYANQFSYSFVHLMAMPLNFLTYLFKPITSLLVSSTYIIDKRIHKKPNFSIADLSEALELTSESLAQEKDILKGIIEFKNTEVSEIMCPRVDVLALDVTTSFSKILKEIIDAGYSRIPVYAKSFDNVKGILYIKDLLPHIHKTNSFHWQSLIRPPYFVPEKKKINDLLEELQTDKIHVAIVVDEYGGTSGIITMEDIIEEIVGDISDEFDDHEDGFTKINDNNYLFEGKTLLNDFYKILEVESFVFDEIKGDADTLAGLILEIKGGFPAMYDKIKYKQFTFTIEALDKRRIVKIKTAIQR